MSDRNETIAGLRALADMLAEHPELPVPIGVDLSVFIREEGEYTDPDLGEWKVTKTEAEKLAEVARALPGRVEKEQDDSFVRVIKNLPGGVTYRALASRDEVCTRKVVGTETVEVPDYERTPTKKVEREIVEWECEPILAGKGGS
jgi:hypothetical protein